MKQADNNKKNRHLTAQDRQEIMNGLDKGLSFKAIALLVQKDPTTISYEVKRHRKEHRNAFVQTDELCPLLDKAPFVCNACPKRRSANCRFLRLLYVAPQAHAEYEALLHDARKGIPLNRASLESSFARRTCRSTKRKSFPKKAAAFFAKGIDERHIDS